MVEELQGLLDKIRRDGVDKAAAERDEILNAARTEAEAIRKQAQEDAEKLRTAAEADCAALEKRAESQIKQAARDILLELKSELCRRLNAIVRTKTGEALTPEFMASLIAEVAKQTAAGQDGDLSVMIRPEVQQELLARLTASVGADFAGKTQLFATGNMGKGIKISKADNEFYDFSEAALAEMVSEFAGSRIGAILNAQENA